MSRKRMSSIRPPPPVRLPSTDGRPKNRLLAALPAEDFRRILPDLETIPLTAKQVLFKRGDPIRYVFFTNEGVCSVTSMMKNGAAVEVAWLAMKGWSGLLRF